MTPTDTAISCTVISCDACGHLSTSDAEAEAHFADCPYQRLGISLTRPEVICKLRNIACSPGKYSGFIRASCLRLAAIMEAEYNAERRYEAT